MPGTTYSRSTHLFVGLVFMTGLAVGVRALLPLLRGQTPEWAPLIVFGGLGLGWSVMTFLGSKSDRGRPAIALAPTSYQALAAVARPDTAALTALLMIATDTWFHRRRPLMALFNFGQSLISVGVACLASEWVARAIPGLPGTFAAAFASAFCLSVTATVLLGIALWIAHDRRAAKEQMLSFAVLTNETIVSCFSALMAVAWSVHPAALLLPAVPLTLLYVLLGRLEQRESDLRKRQQELQMIQELGLQVSAQLATEELRPAVTRIVADDLTARGAALLLVAEDRQFIEIAALFDRAAPLGMNAPLTRTRRGGLDDDFLADRSARILTGAAADPFPELRFLPASVLLVQPLSVLGRPEGAIVVFDDGRRASFTAEDAARLQGLVRFIEVALNNARLYDDLRRMQQHLVQSEKMSALGQLVSGVAHELNNPLLTISGSAQLASDEPLDARTRQLVTRILKESARAARIVRNLLTFSHPQRIERGWHDLRTIVDDVVELRQADCDSRKVRLAVELQPDLPPILVDRYQLQQVLLNLVTNAEQAIELAGRGSGTIWIRTFIEAQRLRLEVADDGPGIREEDLGKIFNPFFTTKPVGKGTGLGLSICYGIIQAHGGTIRVRSTPGLGAVFTIELPLTGEPPPGSAPLPDLAGETAARRARIPPARILVVDDEEGVREVLSEALLGWGHSVRVAGSGLEGLAALRAERFDLAIVDFRMPELDGQGLYEAIQRERDDAPPFIFATGDAAGPQSKPFFESTGARVLLKPFSLVSLAEALEQVLAQAPTASD